MDHMSKARPVIWEAAHWLYQRELDTSIVYRICTEHSWDYMIANHQALLISMDWPWVSYYKLLADSVLWNGRPLLEDRSL